MLSTALNLVNPVWWVYAALWKLPVFLFKSPWLLCKLIYKICLGVVKAVKWGWSFPHMWQRILFTSVAVWIAAPGTNAWLFYKIVELVGYKEEADYVLDSIVTVAKFAWSGATFAFNMVV